MATYNNALKGYVAEQTSVLHEGIRVEQAA